MLTATLVQVLHVMHHRPAVHIVLRPAGAAGVADLRLCYQHCLGLPWGGLQLP